MTIAEVFEYIDEFHPNTVSQSLKLRWINEAEGYIQREVMLRRQAELEHWYRADDLNAVLLAPPPYDEQYVAYLDAKLFYLYHEITDYENAMERYNKIATDYAGWYARMYAPARPRGRWYRHHDDYVEEPLPPIEDGDYYYTSLAGAIADLSSGYQAGSDAAKEQAAVKVDPENTDIGSTIFAVKPGDGSAREQAASCQRVLGASANLAKEYATKRYRSNCINWGMAPLLVKDETAFALGDWVFIPGLRKAVLEGTPEFTAYAVKEDGTVTPFAVSLGALTPDERQIIADGCLINYYRNHPVDD